MSKPDRDSSDGLPQRWVRRAARCAPPLLAERLEEEWLADLLLREGKLSRVGFAFGCWWAAHAITRDYVPARAAVSAGATGERGAAVVDARYDWPFLSRRTIVLLLILALHVLLIYCLANGLARRIVAEIVQPIHLALIEPQPHDVPPRLPLPTLRLPTLVHPRIEVPPVDMRVVAAADPGTIDLPPIAPPRQPAQQRTTAPVNRVLGGPGADFPNTDDYYPSTSRRLDEAGASLVQVCVDGRGRLTSSPEILQSSGSARLDAGAIRLAKAGSGHYRPTTEDGRAIASCYAFRIRFKLRQ